MINIKGVDRAKILVALYNASKQQGMGYLDTRGRLELTEKEAIELLRERDYFDYLHGRVMKVMLHEGNNLLNPYLYDRDNGQGAAYEAIKHLLPVPA